MWLALAILIGLAGIPTLFFTVYYIKTYQARIEAIVKTVKWSCAVVSKHGWGKGRRINRDFLPCLDAERVNAENLFLIYQNGRSGMFAGARAISSTKVIPVVDIELSIPFKENVIERVLRLHWPSDLHWAGEKSIPVRKLEFIDQDIEIISDWTYVLYPLWAFVFFVGYLGVLLGSYFFGGLKQPTPDTISRK